MNEKTFTKNWFTLRDVAGILRVSPSTVRRLIMSGRLKANNASTSEIRPMWRIHSNWLKDFALGQPAQTEDEVTNGSLP